MDEGGDLSRVVNVKEGFRGQVEVGGGEEGGRFPCPPEPISNPRCR